MSEPNLQRAKAEAGAKATLEFLPAALEVERTPPSPAGRALLWTTIALLVCAASWASIGAVDIVSVAPGKIIPSSRLKQVQPFESGVIHAIHVREGQRVEAGDALVDLDPTTAAVELARIEQELESAKLDALRLRLLVAVLGEERTVEEALTELRVRSGVDAAAANGQDRLLESKLAEHRADVSMQSSEIARQRAELETVRRTITKLEQTAPLVARRADAMRSLSERGMGATLDFLAVEQERIEQHHDLQAQRERATAVQAGIASAERALERTLESFRHEQLLELTRLERLTRGLEEERVKALRRTGLRTLRAPVAGVVHELAVHTAGGVVTPAQILMSIVPDDGHLEVEAWVRNRDIGFVHEGQAVEVKIDTFPFTRYGTIDGVVTDLSNDAIAHEVHGPVYAARIRLARATLDVDGRETRLSAGMAVTAEVKTGERRIIEFVLTPLLRGLKEAARER